MKPLGQPQHFPLVQFNKGFSFVQTIISHANVELFQIQPLEQFPTHCLIFGEYKGKLDGQATQDPFLSRGVFEGQA